MYIINRHKIADNIDVEGNLWKSGKPGLQFAKKHVGDLENRSKKVLWCDETKTELLAMAQKPPEIAIRTVKHGGGNIILREFPLASWFPFLTNQ